MKKTNRKQCGNITILVLLIASIGVLVLTAIYEISYKFDFDTNLQNSADQTSRAAAYIFSKKYLKNIRECAKQEISYQLNNPIQYPKLATCNLIPANYVKECLDKDLEGCSFDDCFELNKNPFEECQDGYKGAQSRLSAKGDAYQKARDVAHKHTTKLISLNININGAQIETRVNVEANYQQKTSSFFEKQKVLEKETLTTTRLSSK